MTDNHDGTAFGPNVFENLIGNALNARLMGQGCQVAENSAPSWEIHCEGIGFRKPLTNARDGCLPATARVDPAVDERESGAHCVLLSMASWFAVGCCGVAIPGGRGVSAFAKLELLHLVRWCHGEGVEHLDVSGHEEVRRLRVHELAELEGVDVLTL